MIYLIGFFILAAAVFLTLQFKKTKACKCDKCDSSNCKCEENNCGENCTCHDKTPNPYMNGHSKNVTVEEPVDEDETIVVEPEAIEAPVETPVVPTQEPQKEEPKKKAPKKKAEPKVDPKKKKK